MKILLFTGLCGVGKSAVATELGRQLRVPVLSERALVRVLTRQRGYARGRYWLSAVGVDDVRTALRNRTLAVLLRLCDEPLVILDGVYDPELVPVIATIMPTVSIWTVVVTAPDALRCQYMANRLGTVDPEAVRREMEFLDSSRRAAGMDEVARAANITIENTGELSVAVAQVLVMLPWSDLSVPP